MSRAEAIRAFNAPSIYVGFVCFVVGLLWDPAMGAAWSIWALAGIVTILHIYCLYRALRYCE